MTRKIIQICESSLSSDSMGDCFNISALCDDGTVWYLNDIRKGWAKYPDIPQDTYEPLQDPRPMSQAEYEKFLREEERREQWREEMRQDAFGDKHG